MSEQSAASTSTQFNKKVKQKYEKIRLPTPPPDPVISDEPGAKQDQSEKESDFLEYLDSLQKANPSGFGRSVSVFAPAIAAENAFDHLDKLYKLMDQMLMLREQNAKLHRRVRDLEHLNNLQKMDKHLDVFAIEDDVLLDQEKDVALAETLFENILSGAKREPKSKNIAPSKLRQSILRRQRTTSISTDKLSPQDDRSFVYKTSRRTSEIQNYDQEKGSKVSKWTKVKAAFKWEKASPTVGDAKSQDSGLGGMLPVNLEVARYLRVPSTSDDLGPSPTDSGAAEVSTPGTMSYSSSAEDLHRKDQKTWGDFQSSDDEHQQFNEYIPFNNKDSGSFKESSRNKSHRTPWAKMKDIIQTRNSFKKKNRLSARSDEAPPDEHLCSENEDVFEENNRVQIPQTYVTEETESKSSGQESMVPAEVVARYRKAIAEEDLADRNQRKLSRWVRVKKAFLTSNQQQEISRCKSEGDCRDMREEIQQNYKQLQQKISLEFQDKLQEWEKSKVSPTPLPSTSTGYLSEESRDSAFLKKMEEWHKIKAQPPAKPRPNIQLQSEENLPPEFRKKLQEWQKIKKFGVKDQLPRKKLGERPKWKSVNRSEEVHLDYPPLSEEFLKKLETWKQIKASGGTTNVDYDSRKSVKENKTPSPRMVRKDSPSKHKKGKEPHDKELQWFEKELTKIEKEKQRLERERQKFLEREERLTKLRRSILGGNKKEVLVHTRSGFHRFEGISRKFTQKLYEWEKAQGITPEESTFALLTSCYSPDPQVDDQQRANIATVPTLVRSKSADSIVTSALNLTCPLMSHQPSSLSLNDVENLEKECLADSKTSSSHFMCHSNENLDEDEPEALIVEVEDIIEETAAPLQSYLEMQQTPIYHHEETKSMCEGEACIAPKIQRSESTRAQNNYNFIEESTSIIKLMSEVEMEILKRERELSLTFAENKIEDKKKSLQRYYDNQKTNSNRLREKISLLQDANTKVASSAEEGGKTNHLVELLDEAQDLSAELRQTVEKICDGVCRPSGYDSISKEQGCVIELLKQINIKLLDLRRVLSYICAASDAKAPDHKRPTNEGTQETRTPPKELENKIIREDIGLFKKSERTSSPHGAVRKRIKYRQKGAQKSIADESDDDNESVKTERRTKRQLSRTRSSSESNSKSSQNDGSESAPDVISNIVVHTEPNYVSYSDNTITTDSPVTVFVKTTRKLFTPIGEKPVVTSSVTSPLIDGSNTPSPELSKREAKERNPTVDSEVSKQTTSSVPNLPPLPASPTPQRKISKEISPNIRIMLARYNQKVSGQETTGQGSAGSSASNSPVPWRSPTSERRVKAQTEKYQEEVKKYSPQLTGRREILKSASAALLNFGRKQVTVPKKGNDETGAQRGVILKSSSSDVITLKESSSSMKTTKEALVTERRATSLKYPSGRQSPVDDKELRSKRLQRAKEEFLKSGSVSMPATSHGNEDDLKFPGRNRLSQISMGSDSSYGSSACAGILVKCASAGMINVDVDTYRKIDPEVHKEGYVSLPRTTKTKTGLLGGKFAFSNIASKFRKIKMRRGRDAKMNAVSTLCRHSLVVDINGREVEKQVETSKMEK